MPTNFPTSLDAYSNPIASPPGAETLATKPHSTYHADHNDAIEALEAKVGVDGSAVPSSLDFRIAALEAAGSPTVVFPPEDSNGTDGSSNATKGAFFTPSANFTLVGSQAVWTPVTTGTYKMMVVTISAGAIASVVATSNTTGASQLGGARQNLSFTYTPTLLSSGTQYGLLLVRTNGTGTTVMNINVADAFTGSWTPAGAPWSWAANLLVAASTNPIVTTAVTSSTPGYRPAFGLTVIR